MGSSFVDLDATSTAMKTKLYLDTRFARYFSFRIRIYGKKRKATQRPTPRPPRVELGMIRGRLQTHQAAPLVSARSEAERPPAKRVLFLVKTVLYKI